MNAVWDLCVPACSAWLTARLFSNSSDRIICEHCVFPPSLPWSPLQMTSDRICLIDDPLLCLPCQNEEVFATRTILLGPIKISLTDLTRHNNISSISPLMRSQILWSEDLQVRSYILPSKSGTKEKIHAFKPSEWQHQTKNFAVCSLTLLRPRMKGNTSPMWDLYLTQCEMTLKNVVLDSKV